MSQVRRPSGATRCRTSALVNPAVDQGEDGPALGGRGLAGPVVAQVAQVHPEDHRRRRSAAAERAERGHEGRLAVGSSGRRRWRRRPGPAISSVATLDPAQAPLRGQGPAVGELLGGQRGGHGRRAQHPVRARACRWPPWPGSAESAPPLKATTTRPGTQLRAQHSTSRMRPTSRDRGRRHAGVAGIERQAVRRQRTIEHLVDGCRPSRCRTGRTRRSGPMPRRSASCRRTPSGRRGGRRRGSRPTRSRRARSSR